MSVLFRSVKSGWLLLSEKGSRFRMALACTLLALAFVLPMMVGVYLPIASGTVIKGAVEAFGEYLAEQDIGQSVTELTEEDLLMIETELAYYLTAFVGILATLPAYAWFLTYSWRTYAKVRYGYAEHERLKGRYNYFRSLWAGAMMLARPIVCFILFQAGYLFARLISESMVYDGMGMPMIALLLIFWGIALVLSALFLWLTNARFLVPYYYGRGKTLREAKKLSKQKCARHPFMCDGFSLIFAVMAALSLLSVGVLFILLVLPLMMFTYFSLAEHMDGKKLLED
ncbi:MAG: hypothetical protein IJ011_07920 [Clostridia bacterium]|nr:hypothetical protein [Clostridia bacterium]